jgi:uncharacterized membrane protein
VVLWLAFLLLNCQLDRKSFWVDELFTAHIATISLGQIPATVAADLHPPLYFLTVRLWSQVAGTGEFVIRWLSVFAAMVALSLTYRLGAFLGGRRLALLGLLSLTFSPFFVEFSRMARYYSWFLCWGILSTYLLLLAWRSEKMHLWAGYGLASILLLYTFYLGFLLLLAHGLAVMLYADSLGRRRWLIATALVALSFLPWATVAAAQVIRSGDMGLADFAGHFSGLLLSSLYPFYAFSVGETVFPWFPTAVPAALIWLGFAGYGYLSLSKPWRDLLLLLVVVPVFLTAIIVTYISTGTPFLNAPVRAFAALPYLTLLGSAGWSALRSRFWQAILGTLVGLTWMVSLANGYAGRQYLNPNYIIPAREVAREIAAEAGPGDVVIGEWDSGFSYYFQRHQFEVTYLEAGQTAEVIRFLNDHTPNRVWLVTIGRDRTREAAPVEILNWLFANYQQVEEKGYVEQAPLYRRIKERLLQRPAYPYKLVVRQFERRP